jgi:hypothetical protein
MNFREIAGFIILAMGIISLPFSWWFSIKWLIVSAVLFIVGALIFLTHRNTKKLENSGSISSNLPNNPNIPFTSGDMGGFNSSDD